jgi:hypothetical protein
MNQHSTLSAALLVLALAVPVYAQIPEKVAQASVELAARQAEAIARAQQNVAQEAAGQTNAVTPIELEVVISRYQDDKKVSSLPYSLSVNAQERGEQLTRLRMGASVPVPTMMTTPTVDGKPVLVERPGPFQYRDIGTNIDTSARLLGDGRFLVSLSVTEGSLAANPEDGVRTGVPVIRNFSSSTNLVLRDGQTRQFTAAADRITGEVVRVDVTLRVVK